MCWRRCGFSPHYPGWCFHVSTFDWFYVCLRASCLGLLMTLLPGTRPPATATRWYAVNGGVFFGRFCPLFYSFKGHIMKNKRQCCQLWRCSILVRPGEDDLRFLDRALHINRDPDLISTKVGENWPIILTFVKIRPPFVKKIFHFQWTSLCLCRIC